MSSSDGQYDSGAFLLKVYKTSSKPHKRWQFAFTVIFTSRALLSQTNGVVVKKNISPSSSYRALDIIPADYESLGFSNVNKEILTHIVKEKNWEKLAQFNGVAGVAETLQTSEEKGIQGNEQDINHRREVFGSNTYQKQPAKTFFYFVFESFKNSTIIILLLCAALCLGFGMKEHRPQKGWYGGGTIFVTVFLVVIVSAVSNFRQAKQFDKLSTISSNIQIDVVRDGRPEKISIFEILVGDVVKLKTGDQIPADGLFVTGHSLQVDESSMTGESDHVEVDLLKNPFLLSGAKVVDGYASMVITSVGMDTRWGEMMSMIPRDSGEQTLLQARLDKLTTSVGKVGLAVAFLVLILLTIRYFTGNTKDKTGRPEFIKGETKISDVTNGMERIFADVITIVVLAIPEGLPLAITLTLAYSRKRMMADQAMVRKLLACETMGSATTICIDKTGTLTLNQMEVSTFCLGQETMNGNYSSAIARSVLELLHQAIGLNNSRRVYRSTHGTMPEITGSPTEKAILSWAVKELHLDMGELQNNWTILHVETFNSDKKRSGVLVRKENENVVHVHWKGAAEMILAMSSYYYDSNGTMKAMDAAEKMKFEQIIQNMAAHSLRCIAFAHMQLLEKDLECKEDEKTNAKLKEHGLIFLGLVGLKDPCRPGVKETVQTCRNAGVDIKMITGDNVFTARAIALECGILNPNQDLNNAVVEGAVFQNFTPEERMDRVEGIFVMARSSPLDKLLMVQCLKKKGHVVAVTGDGTNDAPALKEADVGLSMGIRGTEVAKESSDIVILDDNFASIATVLRWGRWVSNNIQKFIQFQLSVNVSALVINFVAAVSAKEPLTSLQLLGVKLSLNTLGALALAAQPPTEELMERRPVGRTEPLMTNVMWRNLITQAVFQIAFFLT